MTAEESTPWVKLQHWRNERMRFEVLTVVYNATDGDVEIPVRVSGFIRELGVWEGELFRAVDWLSRHGYLDVVRAGPTVRITQLGVFYLEKAAGRRRSIRND